MNPIVADVRQNTHNSILSDALRDFPAEPKSRRQWVGWRYEERTKRDGTTYITKVPINPGTGYNADPTNPDTWGSFDEAVNRAEADGLDGVGFVFTEDDPYCGVDLDKCRDPETGDVEPWALEYVEQLDSYAEVSPSGTGVHIICKGNAPGGKNRKGGVEVYDRGRFFTVTGQRVPGTPATATARQFALDGLYGRVFGSGGTEATPDAAGALRTYSTALTDEEVLLRCRTARNGDRFRALYDHGDSSAYGFDDSAADAALVNLLAFYTGPDPERIEALMRDSEAAYRPKWEERRAGKSWLRYDIERILTNRQKEGGQYFGATPGADSDSEMLSDQTNTLEFEQKEKGADERGPEMLSVQTPGGRRSVGQKEPLTFKSVAELLAESGDTPPWLAAPWLVRGGVTDLSGPAKFAGKTTFLMHMLRCVLDGAPFMEEATERAGVVYLTEQGNNITEALRKAGLDERNEAFRLLQWRDTRGWKWADMVGAAVDEAKRVGAGVLVVDTVNRFAELTGEKENQAGEVMAAMNPLLRAAQSADLAVVSIRHANKLGQGRGSTAFEHDVDILLHMGRPEGNHAPNRREITGVGRYDRIPDKLMVELTDDGYKSLGTDRDVEFRRSLRALDAAMPTTAGDARTENELIEAMSEEADGVSRSTLRRAVRWKVSKDDLRKTGEGKKGSPYKYYRPEPEIDF